MIDRSGFTAYLARNTRSWRSEGLRMDDTEISLLEDVLSDHALADIERDAGPHMAPKDSLGGPVGLLMGGVVMVAFGFALNSQEGPATAAENEPMEDLLHAVMEWFIWLGLALGYIAVGVGGAWLVISAATASSKRARVCAVVLGALRDHLTSVPMGRRERQELDRAHGIVTALQRTRAWNDDVLSAQRTHLDLDEELSQIHSRCRRASVIAHQTANGTRAEKRETRAGLKEVTEATRKRVDALQRYLDHAHELSTQLDRLDEQRTQEQATSDLHDLLADIAGDPQRIAHMQFLTNQAQAQAAAIAGTLALMNDDLETLSVQGDYSW